MIDIGKPPASARTLVDLWRPWLEEKAGDSLADLAGQIHDQKAFATAMRDAGLVLAYHDRSDGGLAITLLEMAFAGRASIDVDLGATSRPVAALFSEEPGAVLQVRESALARTLAVLNADDPRVMTRAASFPGRVSTFGVSPGASVRAVEVRDCGVSGTEARLVTSDGEADVRVPVPGRGPLFNVLAATAVGLSVARPQAVSSGSFAKSTRQPSRL